MDPEKNNLSAAGGAGSAVPSGDATGGVPAAGSTAGAPLDFTGMSGSTAGATNGLSMADGLASAQDNLTSAGMAAGTQRTDSIGLDQIGAADPTATMTAPEEEPLVPAAPVPGSIGSAISGPALATNSYGVPAMPVANSAETNTPGGATAAMTAATTAGINTGAESVNGMANAAQVQAPYNPFANTMTNNGAAAAPAQTSSTAVPAGLQPKTEKFSAQTGGKKDIFTLPTIIAGAIAAVFLITTIIFIVLWQNALKDQKIVYVPPIDDKEPEIAALVCSRSGVTDGVEGLDNLTSYDVKFTSNYTDKVLTDINLAAKYAFVDNVAAEGARGYFDQLTNTLRDTAINAGVSEMQTGMEIVDNVVDYSVTAIPDQLVGDAAGGLFLLPSGENGLIMDLAEVQAHYVEQGFECTVK